MQIVVARDSEGLRMAAVELLKEPMVEENNLRIIRDAAGAANYQDILKGVVPTRTLADGYYTRVEYLFGLRKQMKEGLLGQDKLTGDEISGLLAISCAIEDFTQEHWQCPKCKRFSSLDDEVCRCGFDRKPRRA